MALHRLSVLFFFLLSISAKGYGQSGINLKFGVSSLATAQLGQSGEGGTYYYGWHVELAGRLGKYRFFVNPVVRYTSYDLSEGGDLSRWWRASNKLQYLSVATLGGWRLIRSRPFTLRLHGGVDLDFLMAVTANKYGLTEEDFEDLHFQGVGIVGVDVYWLTLDLKFSQGLSPRRRGLRDDSTAVEFSMGFFF